MSMPTMGSATSTARNSIATRTSLVTTTLVDISTSLEASTRDSVTREDRLADQQEEVCEERLRDVLEIALAELPARARLHLAAGHAGGPPAQPDHHEGHRALPRPFLHVGLPGEPVDEIPYG